MYHEIERGSDEAVLIGDTIVRVVEVEGSQVTLAISRPDGNPRYQQVTLDLVFLEPSPAEELAEEFITTH